MAALDLKLKNLAKIQAKLAKLPQSAQRALKDQLATEVDGLVAAIKRAAPDDPKTSGAKLRDSVHAYPNPDRAVSFRILADAKDAAGAFIGAHVEQGHRTVNGEHVAGRPFFFPTYRARKKGMKRRMSAAARKAIRQEWGS